MTEQTQKIISKGSKIERTELYKNHEVQVFLSKFLTGEIERLDPVFDSNHGYKYPLVKAILRTSEEVEDFLAELTRAGILKRELYDKILFCPQCSSPKISIHYNCPHCQSFNIKKSALVEHLKCGYIDTEDHFVKLGTLICPRCNVELMQPDVDHRKAGIWCTCGDCTKNFDIPVPSHFCRNCRKNFTFEDAVYKKAYSYNLSEEAKQEASLGWILIAPMREFLMNHGFKVETPGFLKGKSGSSHMFDITAFKPDTAEDIMVIDLATSTGTELVHEQAIISMFAKIYDVAPDTACLVAIPKTTKNGRRMAKLYNITLIEAKNPEEAIQALENTCVKKQE